MDDRVECRRSDEQGFALVLAILSLMIPTFLGLTLAATTSTELQIATNYRWSQQAQYNAEAGIEAGRVILAQTADMNTYWSTQLYSARGTAPGTEWDEDDPTTAPTEKSMHARDYWSWKCDSTGQVGYGLVLKDRFDNPYADVSTFSGQRLNGAFTLWIRRPLLVNAAGKYSDDPDNRHVVLLSEGVAPYVGGADTFTRAHRSVRMLETRLNLAIMEAGKPCGQGTGQGQEGGSPMGENYNPCAPVTAGSGGSLENVFGGDGAGNLEGTGER